MVGRVRSSSKKRKVLSLGYDGYDTCWQHLVYAGSLPAKHKFLVKPGILYEEEENLL